MEKLILPTAILFIFCITIQAQKEKIKKDLSSISKILTPQATGDDVIIKDESSNTLLRIIDEGSFGSIEIKTGVPSTTYNKLYNKAGILHFNGMDLFTGVRKIDDLSDAKSDAASVYLGATAGVGDDENEYRYNTGLGVGALKSIQTGKFNTAVGSYALSWNTTGHHNHAGSFYALHGNKTGNHNVANGAYALYYNDAGSYGVAVGYQSQYNANNTVTSFINCNTSVGSQSLMGSINATDNTGNNNSAFGYQTLYSNSSGANNTATGYKSLYSNETGDYNTASGFESMYSNTSGNHNTASGLGSLYSNTEGQRNTADGYKSLNSNTTGDHNVGIGYDANRFNQEGSDNTIIGYQAGRGSSAHNKSGNIFIGYQAGYNELLSNKLYIENSSSSSPLIWGDFATDRVVINGNSGSGPVGYEFYVNGDAGGDEAWNNLSDGRLKEEVHTISDALEKIKKLRGVTYKWKDQTADKSKIGFIAQEVKTILPEVVDDSGEFMTMQYGPLTALLVEAMHEQQEIINNQGKLIADLKIEIDKMKRDLFE